MGTPVKPTPRKDTPATNGAPSSDLHPAAINAAAASFAGLTSKLDYLSPEDLEKVRSSLNPQQLSGEGDAAYKARLAAEQRRYHQSPIYNSAVLDDMIAVGLTRLAKMQRPDGGWGW